MHSLCSLCWLCSPCTPYTPAISTAASSTRSLPSPRCAKGTSVGARRAPRPTLASLAVRPYGGPRRIDGRQKLRASGGSLLRPDTGAARDLLRPSEGHFEPYRAASPREPVSRRVCPLGMRAPTTPTRPRQPEPLAAFENCRRLLRRPRHRRLAGLLRLELRPTGREPADPSTCRGGPSFS